MSARRAAGTLAVRHAAGFAINFIGTLVIARVLGPAAWGIYSVGFVAQFIGQGLVERGVVGYLIQRRAEPGPVERGTALAVQTALAALATIVLALLGPLAADAYDAPVLVALFLAVALTLVAYAFRSVPLGLLERHLAYRHVAIVELSDLAAFNVVAIGGVLAGYGMDALVVGTALRGPTSLFVAWIAAKTPPAIALSRRTLSEIVAFGAPFAGANALNYLNGLAAPLFVGPIAGARAFGVLQLAYSLVAYPQVLSGIVGRVAFPAYSRAADAAGLEESVSRHTSRLIGLVGMATLALATSSVLWVPPLYGAEWGGASEIMLIIAPALGIGTALTFVIAGLNALGRSRAVLAVSFVFSAAYWALAATLVPAAGALGLPLAYALASVAFVGYLALFRRGAGALRIRGALVDFLVASVIVALAVTAPWPREAAAVATLAIALLAVRWVGLPASLRWAARG